MPCNLATQAMGQLGGRLLDGLLTGGQDASLEGWPKTCLIHVSLIAPSCAFRWWDSLFVPVQTTGSFFHACWMLPSLSADFHFAFAFLE
mmetsp:Transcript_5732/g.15317  ORF Transcript_5732/g.15317 Transcript_5732/m.15317 type:complete len:89 (-) Transcript_5732:72-338(-)